MYYLWLSSDTTVLVYPFIDCEKCKLFFFIWSSSTGAGAIVIIIKLLQSTSATFNIDNLWMGYIGVYH